MINRVLIRSKVLQAVYAYYQSDCQNLETAQEEFLISMDKTYELYHHLLLLIPEITRYAAERIDRARSKYLPTEAEQHPNTRFIDNRFAEQVRTNKTLEHFVNERQAPVSQKSSKSAKRTVSRDKSLGKLIDESRFSWSQNEAIIHTLYEQIVGSPAYNEYMEAPGCSYEDDKEVWRKLFRQVIAEGDDLAAALEDSGIYWNDDVDIVLTFVTKTIKKFEQSAGAEQELLPQFKDADDREYALTLFRTAILNGEEYRKLINSAIQHWDLDRLALMDLLILQVALAELLEIPEIPVNVSLNEYIDLAKVFSTEKSSVFINGTLDKLVQQLRGENRLFKA